MSGLNTDIKQKGAIFHVQTQDVGARAQYVESLIYKSGKLVSSRKTFYTSFLARPRLGERIQQIIDEQHQGILKDIADGKFDHHLSPEERQGTAEKP